MQGLVPNTPSPLYASTWSSSPPSTIVRSPDRDIDSPVNEEAVEYLEDMETALQVLTKIAGGHHEEGQVWSHGLAPTATFMEVVDYTKDTLLSHSVHDIDKAVYNLAQAPLTKYCLVVEKAPPWRPCVAYFRFSLVEWFQMQRTIANSLSHMVGKPRTYQLETCRM